ncbi:PfkB family carbohydrate kinase [Neobacillus mesonae]|uniref:PfkB family carbohydrate kinase n=1 Tax=Neobacillus mesonae TaxID=1193713 RepID=UPI00082D7A5B|nr:PfkB family carbohydrate kinase [Neobacillus mesonae]
MCNQETILNIIRLDPTISEQAIANKTGFSLEEVNETIVSLIQAGRIVGRSFILPEEKKIVCIGGANVDQKVQVLNQVTYETSNPAVSTRSRGGVARNVAENLGRLGLQSSLLAYIGGDSEGEWLHENTKQFVNLAPLKVIEGKSTGTYTAVLDPEGQMLLALSDMRIYDDVEEDFIEKNMHYLQHAEMVLLDTNFPGGILEQVISSCKAYQIPLCVAPVSAPKAEKLPESLEGVTWLIANHKEAEALAKLKIQTEGDFFRAAEVILNRGVEKVVISRGNQGIIYFTKDGEAGAIVVPDILVTDVTGAGDSLIAGILFGYLKGLSTENACKIGISCSLITIQSGETVNPELNHLKLIKAFQSCF